MTTKPPETAPPGAAPFDPMNDAAPYDPPEGGFGSSGSSATQTVWPDPLPLPTGRLPVPALTESMLPGVLRSWLSDIAERTQAPLDFAAVGAIIALSSLIGRALAIRPKLYDDWTVVPNLWGGVVGRPGVMKSPALRAAMAPLHRLVHEAEKEHSLLVEQAAELAPVHEARIKALKRELDQAVGKKVTKGGRVLRIVDGGDVTPSEAPRDPKDIADELNRLRSESRAPKMRRFLINDATVEKLGEILHETSRGIMLYRDELLGWLRSLERSGHECDRTFYLEAWDGNGGPYTYDRIARGTISIASPCVSILGGIQPGPLARYIRDAVHGGGGDDGLIQRFQLLVYPDVGGDWRNVDRWPDSDARDRAFATFKQLAEPGLAAAVGALRDPDDPGGIPYLRFAGAGLERYLAWQAPVEKRLRSGEEAAALEAHFSKYRSLVPSLALIFHLVGDDRTKCVVDEQSVAIAVAWAGYLAAHARRIYGSVAESASEVAQQLAKRLLASQLPDPFRVRDVYRHGWSGLSEPSDVTTAINVLLEHRWLREQALPPSSSIGGRPSAQYWVNPKAMRDA